MNILITLLGCLLFTDGGKQATKVKSETVDKQNTPAPTVLVVKPSSEVISESEVLAGQNPVAKHTEPIASQLQGNLSSSKPESGNATVKTTIPFITTLTSK